MPDLETPEGDALEQMQSVEDPEAVVEQPREGEAPLEVDDGDLAESSLAVPADDDDWR